MTKNKLPSFRIKGLRIHWNHPHDIAALLEVFVMDAYRIKNIKKGDVVLDLGAGIGEFSILARKLVGHEGLVISVEPNPEDFRTLRFNMGSNAFEDIITINKAFTEGNKEINLQFKGKFFSAIGFNLLELHEILKAHNKDKVDILKMDIEGAEIVALRNLESELNTIRLIMLELHDTQKKVEDILTPKGFRFHRLKRKEYILSTVIFALLHPLITWKLWKLFTLAGGNPGLIKIANGVDISNSLELKVGIYTRNDGR